jgi:3-oxoacyl-[acyl-carrier protein] reductase
MKLKGKVALVTGGGTGIGRAICLALAREGCSVGINFASSEREANETVVRAEAAGVTALALKADVSRDDEVRKMVSVVVSKLGHLDILVNNAGYTKRIPHREMDLLDESTFNQILGVNFKGPFYCVRAAVPHMLANGGGCIVNITSDSAYHGDGSSIVYCAAKAALANMTKAWARALAPSIRVNAVAPGFVDTGFVNWESGVMERAAQRNPMTCITTVEDVAKAVLFFIADAAHITGESLLVDGGETVLGPKV